MWIHTAAYPHGPIPFTKTFFMLRFENHFMNPDTLFYFILCSDYYRLFLHFSFIFVCIFLHFHHQWDSGFFLGNEFDITRIPLCMSPIEKIETLQNITCEISHGEKKVEPAEEVLVLSRNTSSAGICKGLQWGLKRGSADLNKSLVAMQIGKIIIDCRRMVALMGSRMSTAYLPTWTTHRSLTSSSSIAHSDLPQGKLYSLPSTNQIPYLSRLHLFPSCPISRPLSSFLQNWILHIFPKTFSWLSLSQVFVLVSFVLIPVIEHLNYIWI